MCGICGVVTFQPGAKTELNNWSAGFPPLFLSILNQIVTDIPNGQVDNETVNRAAIKILDSLSELLGTVWQDCTAGTQDLFMHLVDCGEIQFSDAGKDDRNSLIEKALARMQFL